MSLKEEFLDKDYRRAYAESFANTVIATQIRLLRGRMTQKEFADLLGIKNQSRVSAMEDENYSRWSTNTLKRIAAKKDVVFLGRFVSFAEMLDWSRRMSEETLAVRPFAEDSAFARVAAAPRRDGASTTSTESRTVGLRLVKGLSTPGATRAQVVAAGNVIEPYDADLNVTPRVSYRF